MGADALVRIEWKLNLVIHALIHNGLLHADLPPLETEGQSGTCPVCRAPLQFRVNVEDETVSMHCACRPPVQVVKGISALLKAPEEEEDNGQSSTRYSREREGHHGSEPTE